MFKNSCKVFPHNIVRQSCFLMTPPLSFLHKLHQSCLFLRFWYLILELFRKYGIFSFSFNYHFRSEVYRVIVDATLYVARYDNQSHIVHSDNLFSPDSKNISLLWAFFYLRYRPISLYVRKIFDSPWSPDSKNIWFQGYFSHFRLPKMSLPFENKIDSPRSPDSKNIKLLGKHAWVNISIICEL